MSSPVVLSISFINNVHVEIFCKVVQTNPLPLRTRSEISRIFKHQYYIIIFPFSKLSRSEFSYVTSSPSSTLSVPNEIALNYYFDLANMLPGVNKQRFYYLSEEYRNLYNSFLWDSGTYSYRNGRKDSIIWYWNYWKFIDIISRNPRLITSFQLKNIGFHFIYRALELEGLLFSGRWGTSSDN